MFLERLASCHMVLLGVGLVVGSVLRWGSLLRFCSVRVPSVVLWPSGIGRQAGQRQAMKVVCGRWGAAPPRKAGGSNRFGCENSSGCRISFVCLVLSDIHVSSFRHG